MTYKPTLPPVTTPNEKPNNRAILQAKFAVDMLSGVTNLKSPDRAVRLGELLESGLFTTDASGLLVPNGSTSADTEPVFTGRNLFINGDFSMCQRPTSGSVSGTNEWYGPDGWIYAGWGVTGDWGYGTDTAGQLPNSRYFLGYNVTAVTNSAWIGQKIERVKPTAGKKMTVSFWMRSNVAGKKVGVRVVQSFGAGGSAATNTEGPVFTLDTVFKKFTATFDVPSVVGKTIGTGGDDYCYVVWDVSGPGFGGTALLGQTGLFEIGECQFEMGAKASKFEILPFAEQLSNCMRYYEEMFFSHIVAVTYTGNGDTRCALPYKVRKRTVPVVSTASSSLNMVGFGRAGEFVNQSSGALTLASRIDCAAITWIANLSAVAPSGAVVVWSSTEPFSIKANASI